MRQVRVYLDRTLESGARIQLEGQAFHHIATVLRMRAGEQVTVFNGAGGEFGATIGEIQRRGCQLQLGPRHDPVRESPLHSTLLQGIAKGDRMDYAIQKGTELGVHRVLAVECARSQVQGAGDRWEKRLRHWQGVAIAAAEQSGRLRVPEVEIHTDLETALQACEQDLRLVLAPNGRTFDGGALKPLSLALLVGPEGGLEDGEITLAERYGFAPWAMGPRVLRTETAGPVALALAQSRWGDL